MTEELRQALEPFLRAARAIPPHFKGEHPLKQQIFKGAVFPTVAQYRDLLETVEREP